MKIHALLDEIAETLERSSPALALQVDEVSQQLQETEAASLRDHMADPGVKKLVSQAQQLGHAMNKTKDIQSWEKLSDMRNKILMGLMQSTGVAWRDLLREIDQVKAVTAAGWEDTAMAELAAELDLDLDLLDRKKEGHGIRIGGDKGSNGEDSWLVFPDYKSAERYAIEYVKEMIDDDPSMFNEHFIKQHVFVSPTDIRVISSEEADNYLADIEYEIDRGDYDRLMSESGAQRAWDKIIETEEKLEGQLAMTQDPKAQKKIQGQLQKLVKVKENLIDKAKDKVSGDYAKDIARRLKDDPLEWAEELGYEFGRKKSPPWLKIDSGSAAKDAVNTDGVGHFLDSYDGDEIELRSGAVAFGN